MCQFLRINDWNLINTYVEVNLRPTYFITTTFLFSQCIMLTVG